MVEGGRPNRARSLSLGRPLFLSDDEATEERLCLDLEEDPRDREREICGTARFPVPRMEADNDVKEDFDFNFLTLAKLLFDLMDIGRACCWPAGSMGAGNAGHGTVGGRTSASSTLSKLGLRGMFRCRNGIRPVRLSLL